MTPNKAPAKPPVLPVRDAPVDSTTLDGKYALIREIGSGSAGSVHEAEHLVVGKRVAIKILHAALVKDETLRERFVGEARAAAQIDHPNIVDIYDFGVTQRGTPYIVMELLHGETLEEVIARRGSLSPAYACEIMVQVLAGLGAAHSRGIVHRDLKPANIVITYPRPDAPVVKMLDFGIASSVMEPRQDEGIIGTPMYMAPEQALGKEVDARADLYAAGVMLYEMLAGETPFSGNAGEVIRRAIAGQWKPLANVNPAVPRLLTLAVNSAMATDPARRVHSAHELARQLTPYVSQPPPHSVPHGPHSADAFLLRAASGIPEIRLLSEPPEGSRPPRDFPTRGLAKIAGRPHGDAIADSLLQSPIIPKMPMAPKIQVYAGIRDVERWSDPPEPLPEDEVQSSGSARRAAADPVFDDAAPPADEPVPSSPELWRRAAWAATLGMGLGAILAWLYHFS
jgi:serine/threonine protein kinase